MKDFDIYDLEDVEDENEDCPYTIEDIKELAKGFIDLFFVDKLNENGKPISKEILQSKRNISLVLNLNICKDMPMIYDSMKFMFSSPKKKGKVSGDIEYVMDKLSECSKRGIPKSFATGILAIYLEVFEGCTLAYEGS